MERRAPPPYDTKPVGADCMVRGQESGLSARRCAFPGCGLKFIPVQQSQRFCTPAHRHDAKRLRAAIPMAVEYLERVLAEMDEPIAQPGGQG